MSEELALFEAPEGDLLLIKLEKQIAAAIADAEESEELSDRSDALQSIASAFEDAGLKGKGMPFFERLIVIAEKITDPGSRYYALQSIAAAVAKAGLGSKIVIPE
ncbi:MAG: hypothetical protein V2A66_03110 [Pseudomonadota bacterium]